MKRISNNKQQRLLYDGLIESVDKASDKTALVIEGVPYTYKQLLDEASRMAKAIIARGVKPGDRVALYMDNTWPCIVSIYATLLSGAVFLIINPQTKNDKLEYILNDSEAKLLLTDAHLSHVYDGIITNLKHITAIIASGDLKYKDKTSDILVESFKEVISGNDPLSNPVPSIPSDLAALIYTSGSTGSPKGVMQTHQSMVFAAHSIIEYQRLYDNEKILLILPLAFDYGLYQLLMAVILGGTLIVERSFTYPAQVFKRMKEEGATVFPAVPTIYAMLIAVHNRKKLCFKTIKKITNTAAALPVDYLKALKEIFPNAQIYQMYGLTECKRVSYLEPGMLDKKPTSVGKAIPGTEVYIRSKEGMPVAAGEKGILHVRGPHIMLGYWKQPELSANMLKDGPLPGEKVLCTQDWFKMDEEGFLYFVGRSDDIIKTRGEKVSPVEVENVLYSIRDIREVAVVGIPDELFGQSVRAYVSLEIDSILTDKEIIKYCMSKLENYMVPKEVIIKDELPKTATGKISKKELYTV